MKVGRNQVCPCGSGQKFKRCHGRLGDIQPGAGNAAQIIARHQAAEHIRAQQQGLGRPILAVPFNDHQIVAVGKRLLWSKKWKTFPDFLTDYLKGILTPEWGNAEIAKPLAERHPILQWYDAYCAYQSARPKAPGEVVATNVTGLVACYLGLAYSLYLLDHNVELQARLVARLKNIENFQGAYYELMVANMLLRAGFELTLEDEVSRGSKHCEFGAVSRRTRKTYSVEAKMRAVGGLLGKPPSETVEGDPASKAVRHLAKAFAKPSDGERLVFIDLNAQIPAGMTKEKPPSYLDSAIRRLERYEQTQLPAGVAAYVFVTNLSFHRHLDEPARALAVPLGVGIPDFNKPGMYRLSETYRREQKHKDALDIMNAMESYTVFPATFDGSLSSEVLHGERPRIMIGDTYEFTDVGPDGTIGTVTTAAVIEATKDLWIGIRTPQNEHMILQEKMSDAALADYQTHPNAYFGEVRPQSGKAKTPYDLFRWFVDCFRELPREILLERLRGTMRPEMVNLSTEDLLLMYCEGLTISATTQQGKAQPSKG